MSDYELIDFGEGRRLERFGDVILDRVCPQAINVSRSAAEKNAWRAADATFVLQDSLQNSPQKKSSNEARGKWRAHTPRGKEILNQAWTISTQSFCLELKLTPFGHIGIFPEQQIWWQRIAHTRAASVLNLFGYTGGSTLAAACAHDSHLQTSAAQNAQEKICVTHVDASRSAIVWGKRNAELSQLSSGAARIRWIVDDVQKFVTREVRRGNRYGGIILDPPSFGRGTHGEQWQLRRDLPRLLSSLAALLAEESFMLLTCHTTGIDTTWLTQQIRCLESFKENFTIECFSLTLSTRSGKTLSLGCGIWGSQKRR